MVVRLRGEAATARHLAVARGELERERRRMKEHAWKVLPPTRTERDPHIPTHRRNNELRPSRQPWCYTVFVPVLRGCRVCLTQFLHNS